MCELSYVIKINKKPSSKDTATHIKKMKIDHNAI